MPSRFTPRRMNGMTVVLRSAPPASPTLAMFPQKSTWRVSPASISPPTLSMAPRIARCLERPAAELEVAAQHDLASA